MSKANRQCVLCKTEYKYCPGCDARLNKPWLLSFCSENCRDLYTLCVRYNRGAISKEEAYEWLLTLDISDLEHYTDTTREIIERILE